MRRLYVLLTIASLCGGCGETTGENDSGSGEDSGGLDASTACQVADEDSDGEDSIECGGLDCDDTDTSRYPGNTEVCDTSGHDEDCDPATFGVRDADGDGEPDARCCNDSTCGTDCDDTRASVSPRLAETCDTLDNDCDEIVDESLTSGIYYADCDGDLFGAGTGEPTAECAPPAGDPPSCGGAPSAGWVTNDSDCDDANASRHPGADEACSPQDDNCVGDGYDTLDCVGGATTTLNVCGQSCVRTCSTTRCEWPTSCVLSRSDWLYSAITQADHDCGSTADCGGLAGWCGSSGGANACTDRELLVQGPSPSGPLPPGSYQARVDMGGAGCMVDYRVIVTWRDGVWVGNPVAERSVLLGVDSEYHYLPFTVPDCSSSYAIQILYHSGCGWMRVGGISFHRIDAAGLPDRTVASWP